jgi:lipoprotein NlpI
VLSLLSRKIDGKGLLQAARNPDPVKERDQLCEAHFYLAESELIAGSVTTALGDFQEAVNSCKQTFIEYSAAKAELKHLGR